MARVVVLMRLKGCILMAGCTFFASAPSWAASEAIIYQCADGEVVKALYSGPDHVFLITGGRRVALQAAEVGSGARYVGGGLQWWSWFSQAYLARLTVREASTSSIAGNVGKLCKEIK